MTLATTTPVPGAPSAADAAGLRKAAVALVALGAERAATLLRTLDESEVTALAGAIAGLGPVTADEVRATLGELAAGLRSTATLPAPGKRFAKDLLVQALGSERGAAAGAVLDRPAPFAWLAATDPDLAAGVLAEEPAAAVALALACLPPKAAAALLVRLPAARRTDVASRIARLGAVHPETLSEVEAGLRSRLQDLETAPPVALAGPELLAGVLVRAGRDASRDLLDTLAETSPELADQVRSALFTFDDLCGIEPRQMQVLLREVDLRQLAVAVCTARPDVQTRFTSALSERARESLLEEVDLVRTSRPAEVAEARAAVVATARRLEEAGTIVLTTDEDEA